MDSELQAWSEQFPVWAWNAGVIISSLLLGFIAKLIITLALRYYQNKRDYSFFKPIIIHLAPPLNFFMPLFALNLAIPLLRLDNTLFATVNKIAEILIVIAFAGLLINAVGILEDYVYHHFNISDKDSLKERKIRTQVIFVKKVIIVIIAMVTIAIVLLHFENFRQIGEGLATGVGIGSVIIGFAAQKPLANFLAGLQIAFTQPIRINDVLMIEGEWGHVEDITLTYVVIKTWDHRRLILPITYFCEKPFQNWTRTNSELLGVVYLYVDYTFPVDQLRAELNRTVQTTELWDKRMVTLLVTNIKPDTIELRALASARNSAESFALRCYVREQLLKYIAENMPQNLPQRRYKRYEDDPSYKNVISEKDGEKS
jgi:small-conductance mechanosensitive channel